MKYVVLLILSCHVEFSLMSQSYSTNDLIVVAENLNFREKPSTNSKIIDGIKRKYSTQDISENFIKFGEIGYSVEFAGDLNRDGVPELIIYEGDANKSTAVYYFKSNPKGEIELQSITWIYMKD
ncbi:MAG: hypothetical protein GY705_26535 [Bacteroidetes bacterium]|nr:hypothetical protein [Bacteroidota bacterium]